MKQSGEDFYILYQLMASQLSAVGMPHLGQKLVPRGGELPPPSHWLMHLVMVGRDVLGITGFNFFDGPVTPHSSFINSLDPNYNYLYQVKYSFSCIARPSLSPHPHLVKED